MSVRIGTTPFGGPVVPLVYRTPNDVPPSVSISTGGVESSFSNVVASFASPRTISSSPAPVSAYCARSESSITIARAPQSLRRYESVSPRCAVLTGTGAAPAQIAPK